MNRFKVHGLITGALPFRDYDCIVTLFTPDDGLIKVFVRAAYSSKNSKGAGITTPLTLVDAVISKGRGDLYTCHEIVVTNHNLDLRKNLHILNSACEMSQAISATQQPGKAAPELFQLLVTYLQRLPSVSCPQTLACSFKLKLLRYEGVLGFLSHCCVCAAELSDTWITDGEVYCREHAPPYGSQLSGDERFLVEQLAYNRNFHELAPLTTTPSLRNKITTICKE